MANDDRGPLPAIPDSDTIQSYISTPERDKALPSLATVLAGPGEVDVGSLLFSPAVPPAAVFGYALGGEATLSDLEATLRSRARATERGKVSKYDAYYAPQTPIPFGVWEYKCGTCRFYRGTGGRQSTGGVCEVVGHQEDWFGGESVHESGWCAMWLPKEGRRWFEYVTDRLEGE
jgi:hypothetical protein